MHGAKNIKLANAQPAKQTYQYKNIKKLYKINAATWCNKTCTQKQLTPNHISFKINGTKRQCLNTVKAVTPFIINQELIFLYIKKQNLNEQLYKIHLEGASTLQNNWQLIQSSTDEQVQ
jgi:hypothetical protein